MPAAVFAQAGLAQALHRAPARAGPWWPQRKPEAVWRGWPKRKPEAVWRAELHIRVAVIALAGTPRGSKRFIASFQVLPI